MFFHYVVSKLKSLMHSSRQLQINTPLYFIKHHPPSLPIYPLPLLTLHNHSLSPSLSLSLHLSVPWLNPLNLQPQQSAQSEAEPHFWHVSLAYSTKYLISQIYRAVCSFAHP